MCLVLAFSSSNTDEDADVLVSIATDVPLPPLKAAGKGLPVAYLEMDNDFSRGQARKALDHFGDRVTWARMDEGRRGPQNEAMAKPSGAVGAFLHSQRHRRGLLCGHGLSVQFNFQLGPVRNRLVGPFHGYACQRAHAIQRLDRALDALIQRLQAFGVMLALGYCQKHV